MNELGNSASIGVRSEPRRAKDWWEDAVGYQVYLPSFADNDGDGWGDLPGVTAHLDHLQRLGVELIWITPFYLSPMIDHGYDIADYRQVDPRFGGDEALDELLAEAHNRGLRVIGDLVVNHSSDLHPWFAAARTSRTDPYRDYYLWREPGAAGGPPNNWLSHFGGPAWTLDEVSGQYYLHLFRPEQPDLNWRNPAVLDEVDAILEYWFSRGLDGMRIDTAACLLKHPDLQDNPLLPDGQLDPVRGVAAEVAELDDLDEPLSVAGITGFRRGSATVLVNLGDQPTQEIELPADAVFDSDDPAVTPQRPRTGRIRLAAQQALLLDHTPK